MGCLYWLLIGWWWEFLRLFFIMYLQIIRTIFLMFWELLTNKGFRKSVFHIILICFIIYFIYSSWKFLLLLIVIIFILLFILNLFIRFSETEDLKQNFSNKNKPKKQKFSNGEKSQEQQNNTLAPTKKTYTQYDLERFAVMCNAEMERNDEMEKYAEHIEQSDSDDESQL